MIHWIKKIPKKLNKIHHTHVKQYYLINFLRFFKNSLRVSVPVSVYFHCSSGSHVIWSFSLLQHKSHGYQCINWKLCSHNMLIKKNPLYMYFLYLCWTWPYYIETNTFTCIISTLNLMNRLWILPKVYQ